MTNPVPVVRILGVVALLVFAVSCGQREDPGNVSGPVADPEVHSITATNEVVTEAQIEVATKPAVVRADFNMDRLEDIAVPERDNEGRDVIAIYLRRQSKDALRHEFYRAGGIVQSGLARISALMSGKRDGAAELIAILVFDDGHKEMVHYRSSGTDFREVMRKPLG